MAQTWVPTWRKRLMLAGLDLIARTRRQARRGVSAPDRPAVKVDRILVVELWNIGDVVLAMPFLAQLRALFPGSKTTLLARPHARVILEGTGLVDEFIETDLAWSERATRFDPFAYRWAELRRLAREMRNRNFDLAFKCRMHIREHVVLGLSGARRRVSFAFGQGDRVLTDALPVGDPHRHKVDDWLKLLEPFGGPMPGTKVRLRVSEAERQWARQYLRSRGVSPTNTLVGIHPGASIPGKRWPIHRFTAVAESLRMRPEVKVLAFVEPEGYGRALEEVEGVISAKASLRELIALIERCDLLVCNDSGPMHIAGALDVPTVAVFGTGINRWFSPLGGGHRMVSSDAAATRSPSDDNTLVEPFDIAEVSLRQVIDAIDDALRSQP